jgi:hypothetical protein
LKHEFDTLKLDIKINPNNPIDQIFIMLKNYSLTHNTFSLINASYTIYKKYISLANPNKKMTSKKSHFLKPNSKLLHKNKSHKSKNYVNYLLTNLNFMVVDYNCC